MSAIIVIPARLGSTRLPEKPLADIKGKPMIQHVYERARLVHGVDRVVVATDHQRIVDAVRCFGGEVVMTPSDLASGTDRVAYVAQAGGASSDIYINLQGDEPLLNPKTVETTLALVASGRFAMATPACPLADAAALENPHVVKVVVDATDRALYFSRFPIPYSRGDRPEAAAAFLSLHHIGVYVYTREVLLRFATLPRTLLEAAESLEQLRALHYGIPIGIARVTERSIGVDTAEDLELVRKLI